MTCPCGAKIAESPGAGVRARRWCTKCRPSRWKPLSERAEPSVRPARLDHDIPDDLITADDVDMVRAIAAQLAVKFPMEFDDLVGAGLEGLVHAARAFDSTQHVKFRTFAQYRVRGAMIDHIRAWYGRHPYETGDGRRYVSKPVAGRIDIGDEQSIQDGFCSFPGADEVVALDFGPAVELCRRLLSARHFEALDTLRTGESLSSLGRRWGVTESRVCQLRREALGKVRGHLEELAVLDPRESAA